MSNNPSLRTPECSFATFATLMCLSNLLYLVLNFICLFPGVFVNQYPLPSLSLVSPCSASLFSVVSYLLSVHPLPFLLSVSDSPLSQGYQHPPCERKVLVLSNSYLIYNSYDSEQKFIVRSQLTSQPRILFHPSIHCRSVSKQNWINS